MTVEATARGATRAARVVTTTVPGAPRGPGPREARARRVATRLVAQAPREPERPLTGGETGPGGSPGVPPGGASAAATGDPVTGKASLRATIGVAGPDVTTGAMTGAMGHEAKGAATGPGAGHRVRRLTHLVVDIARRAGTPASLVTDGPGRRSAVAAPG